MNLSKPISLIFPIIASLSISPTFSIDKTISNNDYFETTSTLPETIKNKQKIFNLIANSSASPFSDPQPRTKDDFKIIPANTVARFESTRSAFNEFEIYSRYKSFRENLLENGWKAKEKRVSNIDMSIFEENKLGQVANPNRSCSITDPKKQAELGIDLSDNSKIS